MGEIVWKWLAGDHLDELDFTPDALELVRKSDHPDYLHVNNMRPVGPNHWFREGDAREDAADGVETGRGITAAAARRAAIHRARVPVVTIGIRPAAGSRDRRRRGRRDGCGRWRFPGDP